MFAGLNSVNANPTLSDTLFKLTQAPEGLAHIPYDDSDCWESMDSTQNITVVQQRRWNTPQSKRIKGIAKHIPSQTRIVAWARIDNRDELISKLSNDLHALCSSDDGLILACYLHWGEACCEQLVGDFAFAIVDQHNQSIFLGRDHTGVKPLYYYIDGKQFVFATSLAVLKQLPTLDLSLNEQWLACYLLNTSADWTKTSYQKINKLPPAHTLTFKQNKATLRQYFEFSLESDLILASDDDYVEVYKEVLQEAVACRVNSDYPIGSESSGGLDSSTVTALASRSMSRPGRELHAFGYDEAELTPECIVAISQSNRMAMTHFASKTRGGDPEAYLRFDRCNGVPVEHSNGIAHHMFYECAEKLGIRTLLSGFGGDEFVTSEAPVAPVEFWRDKQFRLFWNRQRGNLLTKPIHTLRWLYLYYRFNNHSITSRGLQRGAHKSWSQQLLKQSVVQQYDLQRKAQRGMMYDGGQTRQNGFALNNRWSPMMTARYENCTLMAASYGVEYRWPLMDVRLLKLFLSIPVSQKMGPGYIGRYLHRRAVADILPEFITWKRKDMEPFRYWQRLGLMFKRTPLASAVKQAVQNRTIEAYINSTLKDQPPPSLHPLITSLIDEDKLNNTLQVLRNPGLAKEQRRPRQLHLRQLETLNGWLNKNDPC